MATATPSTKTYQIDYLVHGVWTPGNIVKMDPRHMKYYLEFLNGERPLVANGGNANGEKIARITRITREKNRGLPTRLRCVEPDWSQEDGYWMFDGMGQEYVPLTVNDEPGPNLSWRLCVGVGRGGTVLFAHGSLPPSCR